MLLNRVARIARFGVPALALWSLFVWGSRIRNILENDSLRDTSINWPVVLRLAIAVAFVVTALWIFRSAYGLWRDGAADPITCVSGAAFTLAVASVLVWPVRAFQIMGGEWSGSFKAVHTVLAVISVLLGLLVLFHRYGRAGNRRSVRHRESVASQV